MKINIHKIPAQGLSVGFVLTKGYMCEELFEDDDARSFITGPLSCRGRLYLLDGEDVDIDIRMEGTIRPVCYRCLKEFDMPVAVDVRMIYLPAAKAKNADQAEGLESGVYFGDVLDVADIMREQFFLWLPMRYLCSEDCKGLCPSCGADLNSGPCGCSVEKGGTLAEALKKLQV